MSEFGAAFIAFITFAVLPLFDLGIVPVRYALAHEILNSQTHRMAVCTKVTEADKMLSASAWTGPLRAFGITIKQKSLSLRIVNKQNADKQVLIPAPAAVSTQWQPDSPSGPFFYYLELATDVSISPLLTLSAPWSGIPGMTGPATFRIVTNASWENVGRDSESPNEAFFMNE